MKTLILFFLTPFIFFLALTSVNATHIQKDFPLIEGLVDPMTGALHISSVDHMVKGAEPLVFYKNYNTVGTNYFKDKKTKVKTKSIHVYDHGLDGGWDFFEHLCLRVQTETLEGRKGPKNSNVFIKDLNGTRHYFTYYKEKENGVHLYKSTLSLGDKVYRNNQSGEISGRTNPDNFRLEINWLKSAILTLGDGTIKHYELKNYYKRRHISYDASSDTFTNYLLVQEIKPNKNRVIYEYDDFSRLIKVCSQNPSGNQTYATFALDYFDKKGPFKNRDFTLYANGKPIGQYQFYRPEEKFIHGYFFLKNIHEKYLGRDYCKDSFAYDKGQEMKENQSDRVKSKKRNIGGKKKKVRYSKLRTRAPYVTRIMQNGNEYEIEYYSLGDHDPTHDYFINIKSTKDHRCDRVKKIKKRSPNGDLIDLYHFEYILRKGEEAESTKSIVQTRVTDLIRNEVSTFYFKLEKVPTKMQLEYKDGTGNNRTYVEEYYWRIGGAKSYTKGPVLYEYSGYKPVQNLYSLESVVRKGEKQSLTYWYDYDSKGNVNKKIIKGDLCGNGDEDAYQTIYLSTDNGLNLPEYQEEFLGLCTKYTYKPNTNLLTSKITYDKHSNTIYSREYYEYDSDNILIEKIIDNGQVYVPKFDHYHAGTICKITEIIPRKQTPAYNLPDKVIEKYLENGIEYTLLIHKYTYNNQSEVEKEEVCNPKGETLYTLTYNYAENGLLLSKSDPIGRKTFYQYDNQAGWIFHRPKTIDDESLPYTETYHYDAANNLKTKLQQGRNTRPSSKRRYEFVHDIHGNKLIEKDFRGNATTHSYDGRGNPIEKMIPLEKDILKTKTKYDAFGNPILIIDANGNTTQKKYNSYGSVTEIIHPDGHKETFRYTLNNLLERHIDQNQIETKYRYDSFGNQTSKEIFDREGNLISIETKEYDGFALKCLTDPEGNKTSYIYDGAGRKVAQEYTDAITDEITTIEFTYDVYGNEQSKATINGSNTLVSITEKDAAGRVKEKREEDLQGNIYSRKTYLPNQYNQNHKETSYIDGKEIVTTFKYDAFNRLTAQEDPDGNTFMTKYLDNYPNTYGQKVLKEVHTDPLKIITTNIYDTLGTLRSIQIENSTNQVLSKEVFNYDKNLNPTLQKSFVYADGDLVREVHLARVYDEMNRLKTLVEAANIEEEKKFTTYEYTPVGQLKTLTKPDNTTLYWEYDALGFEKSLVSEENGNLEPIHYEYEYNNLGHLLASLNHFTGRTTNRTLDGRGRVLSETLENGLKNTYEYDRIGRATKVTLFDGSTIEKEYDPAYLRKVVRKDPEGNFLHEHTFDSYDLSGNLLQESFSEDTISYSFDSLGRIVSVNSPYFSQTITQYDPKGKIKEMNLQNELYSFEYDDLEQLISEKGRFTHDYLFDSHNNCLNKDGESYEVNHLNQIQKTQDADYEYDPNGNTLLKSSDENIEFDYDALDRLIRIRKKDQDPIEYVYDSFHRRVIKKNKDKETLYLYQGQNEIGEVEDNTLKTFRTLGLNEMAELGSAISLEIEGKLYIPLYDLSLNTAELISEELELAESYRYSAFGQEEIEIHYKTSINPWRFSSKRVDQETGYVYSGRRYYDPERGR